MMFQVQFLGQRPVLLGAFRSHNRISYERAGSHWTKLGLRARSDVTMRARNTHTMIVLSHACTSHPEHCLIATCSFNSLGCLTTRVRPRYLLLKWGSGHDSCPQDIVLQFKPVCRAHPDGEHARLDVSVSAEGGRQSRRGEAQLVVDSSLFDGEGVEMSVPVSISKQSVGDR